MNYRPRIYYTETDKALMWDRWQKGESLKLHWSLWKVTEVPLLAVSSSSHC